MRRIILIVLIVAALFLFMFWFSNANAILTKPGAFGKTYPLPWEHTFNSTITLRWQPSQGAEGYQYCLDPKWEDRKCNTSWVDVGNRTQVTLHDFLFTSIYAWTVRAYKGPSKTMSDNGDWWLFYLNTAIAPVPTFAPSPTFPYTPAPIISLTPTPSTTALTPPPYPPPVTESLTPAPVITETPPPYP